MTIESHAREIAELRARCKARVAAAIAAEREACALIADQVAAEAAFDPSRELTAERIADAIRARANKKGE